MNPPDPQVSAELASGWLLAVDPGLRYPAAAVFRNGVLQRAERVKVPTAYAKLPRGERIRQIAGLVGSWGLLQTGGERPKVVYEYPQVYRAKKSKGDPNDLLPLAGIGGAVSMMMGTYTHAPTPFEWIGGIPKATVGSALESPRGRLIWRLLNGLERLTVTLSHDALDAVGLGLHGVRRLHRFA